MKPHCSFRPPALERCWKMNNKLPIVLILGWIVINVSASADQVDPESAGSIDTTINDISTGGWRNVIDVEYHDDAFAIHYSLRSSRGKIHKAILRPEMPGEYQIKFISKT